MEWTVDMTLFVGRGRMGGLKRSEMNIWNLKRNSTEKLPKNMYFE